MLYSAHIEMSSKAGQNIPIFVAIHLQELLPGSSCDTVTLTLSQRPWSCMDELGGRSATATATNSHFLGYLGLQPWCGLRGSTTLILQDLYTSARSQSANQKSHNQLCPVTSNSCQRRKHHSLPWYPASPGGQIRDWLITLNYSAAMLSLQ